jgi:DNA-binding NarL/FixJ family response regulator
MTSVRVMPVDDQDLVRGGLAAILSADETIDVIGQAADGPTAVEMAGRLSPDVVLMDIEMPGGDGILATDRILATCPTTRVLMLTTFDLDEYVYQALRAGASGFLLKTTPPAQLSNAVRACAQGETLLAPSVTRQLIETFVQRPLPTTHRTGIHQLGSLTPREVDILIAVAGGKSNAEISSELFLSEATVKTHITHILAKLGLRDRVQAVVLAYEAGLVVPSSTGRPGHA